LVTYAKSWGLLARPSIDMCRLLAKFVEINLGSCMDAVCDLHQRKRVVQR
jgi:hypothetical protein